MSLDPFPVAVTIRLLRLRWWLPMVTDWITITIEYVHEQSFCQGNYGIKDRSEVWSLKTFATTLKEGVAKGSEKKGTTKDTKSTKKSFSFP